MLKRKLITVLCMLQHLEATMNTGNVHFDRKGLFTGTTLISAKEVRFFVSFSICPYLSKLTYNVLRKHWFGSNKVIMQV